MPKTPQPKLRLFASADCPSCLTVMRWLDLYHFPYEYVDAFADDTQDLCDDNMVDDLPHLQVIIDSKAVSDLYGEITHDKLIEFIIKNIPDEGD